MTTPLIGLTLSAEEHPPARLVEIAVAAEAAGFDFVSMSDHFHPWIEEQGHSPFVWSVLGAISAATHDIDVAVGVTCPIMRIHPVILAQAAATTGCLLEGRFTWGLGTGESLNEHITGLRWPPADIRLDMLGEAIEVIRRMWTGESVTFRGEHFTIEDARIFDLPASVPLLVISAFGPDAARLAAEEGDGLWVTGIQEDTIARFRDQGGEGPVYTQLSLCWDEDEEMALERAHRLWPNTGLTGQLAQDLRTVEDFEAAVEMVGIEDLRGSVPCGPKPEPILESISKAVAAGADHVYLHQIGDPLDGFIDFFVEEIAPEL
jgi:G6PDH family F420-dependent oxidoreductase